jgi:predicted nucleic acid-binding protein
MRYLLDTNVLSEAARGPRESPVLAWLRAQAPLDLAISVLTIGEIQKGVALLADSKRRAQLDRWLNTELPRQFLDRVIPIDDAVARAWGRLRAAGRKQGRELPVIDGLLLATALVHELTFVTRNEADCAGRGIPVLNPWQQGESVSR